MKISNETIQLLKNYSSINSNLLVREGNVLSTISGGSNIFARAEIAETFPKEVAIYDLNSLLALLTLADNQEVEFGEKSLTISKDGGEFEYFYSDSSILLPKPEKWPTKTPSSESFFTFSVTAQEIQTIMKSASIVGASTLSLVGNGKDVTLKVGDPKIASSNSYKKLVGECDTEFDARLCFSNLKIIPDQYTVSIGKKKFLHFKSETRNYQIWIALEQDSTI